ncbi:MAG: N-acetylmuramoyl-L-alanine amidase LytC [Candidatus Dichloromethanomonas elyunquensis]|nr:MAG: N-acetylmuramoyl-L-alanine amidase LytC [Candidatus Dichloromethanomonas elyunquensis]
MFQKRQRVLSVLLALLLALPFYSIPAYGGEIQGYQNPSPEEIARKIEIVARIKGIPGVILKTVAFVETGWRQFDNSGNVVMSRSSHPGLGIMQVTSYNSSDKDLVNKLKYDIDFNIAAGADILNTKWDMVPQIGDGDRNKLENWYFALWAYNSWSTVNNPNNAAAQGRLAYQDKIIKNAAAEYYSGAVTPVKITPVPPELLPAGTLPKSSQTWKTPEPFTLGDLKVGTGDGLNRGTALGTVTRISGANRIDTVNQIALTGWPHGADTVIITRADNFPDALAGVPLAAKNNAPILVTNPNELDEGVIQVLKTLKPLKAIILGGETAVSRDVEKKLSEVLYWTKDIRRIAGADRYETAALIAKDFPKESNIALATGMDFPDALSLASAAAANSMPLLITDAEKLPEATRKTAEELLPRGLYIAGGDSAISSRVIADMSESSGISSDSIIRITGSNRYETSEKIAETFYPRTEELYIATGQDFADPLAAGALAAAKKACLLLVSPQGFAINSPTETYLKNLQPSTNVKIIGGEDKISKDTETQIKYLLKQI